MNGLLVLLMLLNSSDLKDVNNELFELTDRITVLHYGKVVADGLRDEVTANPLVQEIYLGAS